MPGKDKTMSLIPDWRRVVASSLSFWMQAAGLLVLIAPEIRYALTDVDSDPRFLWWLGVLLLVAGLAGRVYRQGVSWWREWLRLGAVALLVVLVAFVLASGAGAAARNGVAPDPERVEAPFKAFTEAETLAVAVPFIAGEEGKRNRAYQDIVGVWTVCYGSTRGVTAGMVKTDAECLELLRAEVAEYREGLHRYFVPETIKRRLTPHRDTAYTSLAFNAGIGAIGKSTAVRRLNAGNIRSGCEAIGWWNKAGGRVIRGLKSRRAREVALCLQGL